MSENESAESRRTAEQRTAAIQLRGALTRAGWVPCPVQVKRIPEGMPTRTEPTNLGLGSGSLPEYQVWIRESDLDRAMKGNERPRSGAEEVSYLKGERIGGQ